MYYSGIVLFGTYHIISRHEELLKEHRGKGRAGEEGGIVRDGIRTAEILLSIVAVSSNIIYKALTSMIAPFSFRFVSTKTIK